MRDTTALQTHTITSYLLPICHFEHSEKSFSHLEVISPARLINPTKMSSDCD
jgi:hypothetical protein